MRLLCRLMQPQGPRQHTTEKGDLIWTWSWWAHPALGCDRSSAHATIIQCIGGAPFAIWPLLCSRPFLAIQITSTPACGRAPMHLNPRNTENILVSRPIRLEQKQMRSQTLPKWALTRNQSPEPDFNSGLRHDCNYQFWECSLPGTLGSGH